MRKTLLATSSIVAFALAGPAYAADPLALEIKGGMRAQIGQYDFDQSNGTGRGYGMSTPNVEINFTAKGKADNGMSYGVTIESAGNTGAPDEAYMFASGDWGRIELGNQDGAADRMVVSGATALVATKSLAGGLGSRQYWGGAVAAAFTNLDRYDGSGNGTGLTLTGDDTKLIYFTPRFSGFQAGASLTPSVGNPTGQAPRVEGAVQNVLELGANYVGEFSGAKVTVAGTYQQGDAGTPSTTKDHQNWTIGAVVNVAGFNVGAGYQDLEDSSTAVGTNLDAGKIWNVGVGYMTGPWGVSVGYQVGVRDVSATQEAEVKHIVLGAQYAVAPGWTAMLEYNDLNMQNDATPTVSNDASSIVLTNNFSF
jgi:outer membrane protein OmpU